MLTADQPSVRSCSTACGSTALTQAIQGLSSTLKARKVASRSLLYPKTTSQGYLRSECASRKLVVASILSLGLKANTWAQIAYGCRVRTPQDLQ